MMAAKTDMMMDNWKAEMMVEMMVEMRVEMKAYSKVDK